ncbi:DMT family transporter [Catenovulum sp. 2E275]|uniref:DMT family transporter n=1 Tax=Catenovulum sp. 2E275 TaxID=2980497 RepID=UPI0021D0A271|nr:DMT family transporter [Catenovulum sp. 2E275]MCU4677548.1 DMT family transporter [Catenovulum sp. 2E275]
MAFFFCLVVLKLCNPQKEIKSQLLNKVNFIEALKVGLLLQVFYLSFYFLSLRTGISAALVTLILGIQPVLTPFLLRVKQRNIALISIAFGFIGLLLAIVGDIKLDGLNMAGVAFAFLAVLSITIGSIKQGKSKSDITNSIVLQNLIAGLVFCSINSLFFQWEVVWTLGFWVALIWMSLIVSTGAFILLMFLLKTGDTSKVSNLFYCVPVLTMILDYLLFGQTLSIVSMVGVIIVLVSVVTYQQMAHGPRKSI